MSKRNVLKALAGKLQSELVTKVFGAINSGDYGTVVLPGDTDAISIKNDISLVTEYEDEKSGAKTQARSDYASVRMKGKTKVTMSTHLHMTKDNTKESPIGKFLELVLGKREVVAADRGASVEIKDPHSTVAGVLITTAGAWLGAVGNYVTLVLVNGGATGTAAIAKSGKVVTLTYFNNSTVEDVALAIDADADIVCTVDANGDDSTDLFADLLATRALVSGSVLYLSGGAKKGFLYSNADAPSKDMTLLFNKEKSGQVVAGVVFDKLSVEIGDNIPAIKVEGTGRKSLLSGVAVLTHAPSGTKKLYVGSEYKKFTYDASAPTYVDVLDNDGITYKSKGNKITAGPAVDGTGNYIEVANNVTADIGDIVIFTEPENYNPVFSPINGLSGSVEIDGIAITKTKNFKFEYANNHQMFDNLAFSDTLEGYAPAKMVSCKMSVEVMFNTDLMPLIQKLQAGQLAVVPMKVEIGNKVGETMVIFARNLSIKSPDMADKADEVTMFTIEGELVVTPETADQASITISLC